MSRSTPRGVRPAEQRGDDEQRRLDQLGERVRTMRRSLGLSQEQLAHEAGLHRAVIGFIERGEREMGVTMLWPIAAALGVAVTELVDNIS